MTGPSVEMAAILMSDLVGSTKLATSVGPERADELRREHFEVLRGAIEQEGGVEVKNTGDGLMVAFKTASAAVACAKAMHQVIDRRNRGASTELHIRVGIGMGEATVEDGDYFGMPSIEAARLCARARDDGILVGELVRMMAGRGDREAFQSVGELELKGIPEPVAAYEVAWEPMGAELSAVPLPGPLRTVPRIAYVGREDERERLAEIWTAAQSGARRAVLISGEPGIGKTRLASHTALAAHGDGATVLWGGASQDLGVAYGPWIEALERFVEHAPEDVLLEHIARHRGEITRLARGLRQRITDVPEPQESDSETERFLLFAAVAGLLEAAAVHRPMTLVLDDFQWADAQSITLLKHVVRTVEHAPLLLIVTYRDSDLARDHPLTDVLADLRRVEGVDRMALAGFGANEVAAVMTAAAGHEISDEGQQLAAEIAQETGGNPFFVGEILQHLTESGGLAQDDEGRWRLTGSIAELGLPQSVREVVGRRVEQLGDELREILTAAAVIGRTFELEVLMTMLDRPEDKVLDALETALESSVVTESPERVGRFSFSHALINHTLYEDLSATRRARMHRRVAEALEALYGQDPGDHLPELANHFSRAVVSVDRAKAVEYARRAGDKALEELAPDEALRWFRLALELAGPGGDERLRCDLQIGIGTGQRHVGDPEFRQTLLDAAGIARTIDDPERLVRATLENTRGWFAAAGEVDAERVDGLEAALAAMSPDSPDRPVVLSQLATELTFAGDFDRVSALIDEALRSARSFGDKRRLARVMYHCSFALLGSAETARQRWELNREFVALADDLADPFLQVAAAQVVGTTATLLGKRQEMDGATARQVKLAEHVGQPLLQWSAELHVGIKAMFDGEIEQAEAAAIRAATLGAGIGQADAAVFGGFQLFVIRYEQGRLAELVEILEQRVAENPGLPALLGSMAVVYTELGRFEEARQLLDNAAVDDFVALPRDFLWLNGMGRFAEVAAGIGATDHAEVLYEQLLPFREYIVSSVVTVSGSAERVLGALAATLERWEAAEEHFAAAAEIHERLGAPLFLARTWMNWGRALLAKGDAERARSLLKQSVDLARRHGGAAIERDAEALLATAPHS